ncbi:hypothetical protein DFH06DRAFT_1310064 [Mycena polygramma]|nr:hypothetical protein DFH06DRAFT_1310064 [Mycena polygramma]
MAPPPKYDANGFHMGFGAIHLPFLRTGRKPRDGSNGFCATCLISPAFLPTQLNSLFGFILIIQGIIFGLRRMTQVLSQGIQDLTVQHVELLTGLAHHLHLKLIELSYLRSSEHRFGLRGCGNECDGDGGVGGVVERGRYVAPGCRRIVRIAQRDPGTLALPCSSPSRRRPVYLDLDLDAARAGLTSFDFPSSEVEIGYEPRANSGSCSRLDALNPIDPSQVFSLLIKSPLVQPLTDSRAPRCITDAESRIWHELGRIQRTVRVQSKAWYSVSFKARSMQYGSSKPAHGQVLCKSWILSSPGAVSTPRTPQVPRAQSPKRAESASAHDGPQRRQCAGMEAATAGPRTSGLRGQARGMAGRGGRVRLSTETRGDVESGPDERAEDESSAACRRHRLLHRAGLLAGRKQLRGVKAVSMSPSWQTLTTAGDVTRVTHFFLLMKPEQPGPENYTPSSSSSLEFEYTWKNVRVNPQNIDPHTFPFHLELQPEQNRYNVRFLEFRSHSDPPHDNGNPGDIWLNVSPAAYALFALSAQREWVRWAGPGATLDPDGGAQVVLHPYLPLYVLWCTIKQASWYHRDKLARDWMAEKLAARRELGGYTATESMLDASEGVRLILLREEMERCLSPAEPEPEVIPTLSINDQLKAALGDLAASSTSALPLMHEALVATLSSGIDYLLTERRKLAHRLFEADERAARAELKLSSYTKLYPTPQCHYDTPSSPTIATPSPPQSSPTFPLRSIDPPIPISSMNAFTEKHLDIFFRPAEDGRSKNCRVCLTLITPPPNSDPAAEAETSSLLAHALHAHPDECAVFAAASDEELEAARRELAGCHL